MRYDDPKWHQHHPTPVETQVQIADMKARIRDVMIRETHVRVGDHPPEPRHKHEAVAYCVFCKREHAGGRICGYPAMRSPAELHPDITAALRAAFARWPHFPTPLPDDLYARAQANGFDMIGYVPLDIERAERDILRDMGC